MTSQEEAEAATSKFIEEFVKKHWDDRATVCYLSKIGAKMKHEVPESRLVLSDGLHEFLRQKPIVRVVQYPGIEQKIGAIPLSVDLPDDVRGLFEAKSSIFSKDFWASYDQDFWDAFIKPIEEGNRFVCVYEDDRFTITDAMSQEAGVRCFEILTQDLTEKSPGGQIVDRVKSTHEAIDVWLEKHSLDKALFTPRRKNHVITGNPKLVDFINAFRGLSHEDLARIEIPLDILVKLNSEK